MDDIDIEFEHAVIALDPTTQELIFYPDDAAVARLTLKEFRRLVREVKKLEKML